MARRRTWERRNRGMTDLSAKPLALIKGAGDLATGVALRLHHVGFRLVMTEIEEPTVVRRTVALAEAVYEGESVVEGMKAVLALSLIHISEPTRRTPISYAVFCLKKKKNNTSI